MSYLNASHNVEWVNGHFEVFDRNKKCIASGDTKEEAIRDYENRLVEDYRQGGGNK